MTGAPQGLSHWYSEILVTETDDIFGKNLVFNIHICHAQQYRTLKILSEEVKSDNLNKCHENLCKSHKFLPITHSHRVRPVPREKQGDIR